ncbi:MAG TPA: hypothetical protein PK867_26735, partial [Pirellulales bacterium]|nr:hypothetical protein [Pirellulales bacterium]
YDQPRIGSGIRCLILYPMNALVNDQVDRLYGWLRDQTRVTLFHFTSETPENKKSADHNRTPDWSPCRPRTRQEARGLETREGRTSEGAQPPDILITNYSMLEYMLSRPQDSVFFGSALQAVVLDEAHLYTGTLAAEIALLLRRLFVRCDVSAEQILQIATSATLGTGSGEELRTFAATLFSKSREAVHVIEGGRARAPLERLEPPSNPTTPQSVNACTWLDRPLLVANHAGDVSLTESPDLCERLRSQLSVLTASRGPEPESRPAALLFGALAHAPTIHDLEEILWSAQRLSLTSLSQELWDDAGADAARASLTLLQLAAAARPTKDSYPLVPHRLHLLVRATDGLSVCTNRECTGPEENRLQRFGIGAVSAGTNEKCAYCSAINLRLLRCSNCAEPILGAFLHQGAYRAAAVDTNVLDFFTTDAPKDRKATRITIDVPTGARTGAGSSGLSVSIVRSCPRCNADDEQFQPFASGPALTLAILAETVLSELPEFPAKHNPYLPARGRRLLAFSDSRQEAARLGPRLTRQHETQLVRAAVVQSLEHELAADAATIDAERREIGRLKKEVKSAASPAARQRAETLLRDAQKRLDSYLAGGKMSDWAKAIGDATILAEVVDIDSAQRHVVREQAANGDVREWSQRDWERNWNHVKASAMTLLAREFITPSWRAISTETLGLAEVTYPGIQRLEPPAAFIGTLPSDDARTAVSACWYDLLCALCDTLRAGGAITFGNDESDWSYQTGGAPVGQWSAKNQTGPRLFRFVGERADQ